MKLFISFLFILFILGGCKSGDAHPENAIETGRAFIRASLDGELSRAESLLLKDTANMQLFDSYKAMYKKLPEDQREGYKNADFNILKLVDVSDTVTVIQYSNTYMNKPMELKVIKPADLWLVDFKYSYSGN